MTQKDTTVRYTLSEIKEQIPRGDSKTRDDAPEAEPIDEDFWQHARVVMPSGKTSVHLRIDRDVFEWFKAQGEGHLTRMNAVLRSYVDAHKHCRQLQSEVSRQSHSRSPAPSQYAIIPRIE